MNVVHSQYVCSAFRAYTKVNGYAYPAGNIRAAVHNFLYQHGPNSEQLQKEMWGCHWPGQHRRKRVSFMIVPHWLLHIKLNKVYLFQSCEGPMCLKSLRLELLICSLTSKLQINQKRGERGGWLMPASCLSPPQGPGMQAWHLWSKRSSCSCLSCLSLNKWPHFPRDFYSGSTWPSTHINWYVVLVGTHLDQFWFSAPFFFPLLSK